LQPRTTDFRERLACYRFGQAVAISKGVVLVGAPKAKRPCAPSTKNGAAFAYLLPEDGIGLKARETPWWWGQGPTYHQLAYLVPALDDFQIEFGYSVVATTTVWLDGPEQTILLVGSPGVANDQGAIFLIGPINASSPTLDGLLAPMRQIIGPAYLKVGARFGEAMDVDHASGLALIGAPNGFTAHGHTGAAVRSRLLHDAFPAYPTPNAPPPLGGAQVLTSMNDANASSPPTAPPPPPDIPLREIDETLFWGPDAEPGDQFGSTVALATDGHCLVGAISHAYTPLGGSPLTSSGAAYMYLPTVASPFAPPLSPPPPWRPDFGPPQTPPLMPPPAAPPSMVAMYATVSGVGGLAAGLLLVAIVLRIFFPLKYDRYVRCRKPLKELREDTGRGPVADQLRAILADQGFAKGSPEALFAVWDKDGEGSVSRKEFRQWWPTIGYDVPPDPLNDLFDEFDVDGSGEIDTEEFTTAFNQKGELWKELEAMQKQHDEDEDLQRKIDELRKKIERKHKQLAMEKSQLGVLLESEAENKESLARVNEEIIVLNQELKERQARLDAFKMSIKTAMKANTVVNAFKAALSPDEAAVAIQARVRGRTERRKMEEKLKQKRAASAAAVVRAASGDDGPREAPSLMVTENDALVLGLGAGTATGTGTD
jgi:hypothetical protein